MSVDDRDYVARTMPGDRAAFEEFVGRNRDAVYAVAYHYLGRADDAQDAAQEAFVQAYLNLDQLRDPGKLRPWLMRIASNAAMGMLRRRGCRETSLEGLRHEAASSVGDPEREAVRMVVRQALAKLPEKMRLTVTLSYIDGYSHAEVADFLEIPVNTVRSRLQHAKRLLREDIVAMVSDVMHEDKPDPEFNRKVVDEALSRAREAVRAHAMGDALTYLDQAISSLEKQPADDEVLRLRMEALWERGDAEWATRREESLKDRLQALEIAEQLGDRRATADKLVMTGVHYANSGQPEKSIECYRRAADAFEALGDPYGQGSALMWIGSQRMLSGAPREAETLIRQALGLFQQASNRELAIVCLAALDLLDQVGADRVAGLAELLVGCEILERKGDAVLYGGQPGWSRTSGGGEVPALGLQSVFWQISGLRKILDTSVPVGEGWSGDAFSCSFQPLKAAVTVRRRDQQVEAPAGTFENCLLLEQVTRESGLPDEAPSASRELNRRVFCGARQAWFAPGVGLVQLHVRTEGGNEATLQLQEYHIEQQTDEYLPLAEGNAWSYGWAGIPPDYVARESYRVMANEGERWFLEHIMYAYRR